MYEDQNFLGMKNNLQEEIIAQAKQEVERKHIIKDCDTYIEDLQKWKEERKKNELKR